MSISKVDQAITVINYLLAEQRTRVKDLEKLTDPNEKQRIFMTDHYKLSRATETLINQFKLTMSAHLGKLPPQVTDFERSVLGKVMLHSLSEQHIQSDITQVQRFLFPEHFYIEAHREIYKACLQIYNAGRIVDMRSVVWQLRQNKTIEQVGGAHYISELTSGVSSTKNIEWEARLIIEQAIKRRLIMTCSRMMSNLYEPDTDCFISLDEMEEEVKRIKSEWIKP